MLRMSSSILQNVSGTQSLATANEMLCSSIINSCHDIRETEKRYDTHIEGQPASQSILDCWWLTVLNRLGIHQDLFHNTTSTFWAAGRRRHLIDLIIILTASLVFCAASGKSNRQRMREITNSINPFSASIQCIIMSCFMNLLIAEYIYLISLAVFIMVVFILITPKKGTAAVSIVLSIYWLHIKRYADI